MLERERLESKKISKTGAVTSMLNYEIGPENIHVGPSIMSLADRSKVVLYPDGRHNLWKCALNLECKVEVWTARTLRESSSMPFAV